MNGVRLVPQQSIIIVTAHPTMNTMTRMLLLGAMLACATPGLAGPRLEYTPEGLVKGYPLEPGDPMLSTTWVGDALGLGQGNVRIKVDAKGRYEGQGIYRTLGDPCLRLQTPWFGRLYKVTDRVYAAWNEEADNFFSVFVDPSYQHLFANLVARDHDILERNELIRIPNDTNLRLLIDMILPFACTPPAPDPNPIDVQ